MQIEIFNLPHCYLFWPRISTFNCRVFFVWDSQLLVWSDLLQVELQLFSLYPPLRVQGPWRRTQLLHLFVGDDGHDVGDDDGDLQIHQVYGFFQFSFGPLQIQNLLLNQTERKVKGAQKSYEVQRQRSRKSGVKRKIRSDQTIWSDDGDTMWSVGMEREGFSMMGDGIRRRGLAKVYVPLFSHKYWTLFINMKCAAKILL